MALIAALAKVFPDARHLHCVWHVNKNILSQASKKLENTEFIKYFMNDWNSLIYSSKASEFDDGWASFQNKWAPIENNYSLVRYIDSTWIIHKTKIVRCWNGQILPFVITSTSRGEGNHWALKRVLGILNNDLLTAFCRIQLVLKTQLTELKAKLEMERSACCHRYCVNFLVLLSKMISRHTLDLVLAEYKIALKLSNCDECTGLFRKSFRVPCRHEIKERISQNGFLYLENIHRQWYSTTIPNIRPRNNQDNRAKVL